MDAFTRDQCRAHSAWFWDKEISGGGAVVDMGCHCIELSRAIVGKDIKPIEVFCWADTQVHPIDVEDHAIGLIKYETGAIGSRSISRSGEESKVRKPPQPTPSTTPTLFLIKEELMPDGKTKVILKEKVGGAVVERVS